MAVDLTLNFFGQQISRCIVSFGQGDIDFHAVDQNIELIITVIDGDIATGQAVYRNTFITACGRHPGHFNIVTARLCCR